MTKQQFKEMSEYLDTNPVADKRDVLDIPLSKSELTASTKPALATLADFFPSVKQPQTTKQ